MSEQKYRGGSHQPQNVYRDDQYIGVMFSPEDAALVVAALNSEKVERPEPVALIDEDDDRWNRVGQDAYVLAQGEVQWTRETVADTYGIAREVWS